MRQTGGGGGVGEVAAEPAALGGSRNVGLHGSVGTLSVFVPGALPGSLERTVPIGSKKKCSVTQDNLRSDGGGMGINTD